MFSLKSLASYLVDKISGETVRVTNGGLDVNIQDQFTDVFDLHLTKELNAFTIAVNTSIDDTTFTATAGHLIVVGDMLCIREGTSFYQGEATNVATDVITLDTPLQFAFTTSATCTRDLFNMNVNGSVTPVIFTLSPHDLTAGIEWDLVRFVGIIEDTTIMDTAKFGGIAALTNGIVVRKKNGTYNNLFNAKSNGDLASHVFDVVYDDRAPSGSFGFRFRRTMGGQSKNGVTIRLKVNDGDEFQIIIQDDLTGLTKFHIIAQGHIVE